MKASIWNEFHRLFGIHCLRIWKWCTSSIFRGCLSLFILFVFITLVVGSLGLLPEQSPEERNARIEKRELGQEKRFKEREKINLEKDKKKAFENLKEKERELKAHKTYLFGGDFIGADNNRYIRIILQWQMSEKEIRVVEHLVEKLHKDNKWNEYPVHFVYYLPGMSFEEPPWAVCDMSTFNKKITFRTYTEKDIVPSILDRALKSFEEQSKKIDEQIKNLREEFNAKYKDSDFNFSGIEEYIKEQEEKEKEHGTDPDTQ